MVDGVRRRVQQDTLGHRVRKGDPLYDIRRILQIGAEHLTDKQSARLDAKLKAGDPDHEVALAWQCYQKLRNIYHARPERVRELVNEVIGSFPSSPIPEVARLGRTLKQWKTEILGLFRNERRLQRPYRGNQRRHRNHPQNSSRLPQLHQLPAQMSTRRRRPQALPDQTDQPCLNAKGPFDAQA